MLFPAPFFGPPMYLHPRSWNAIGHECSTLAVGSGVAAWPSANVAFFYPFQLTTQWSVKRLFMVHGSPAGNIDVGIYSRNGFRIASSGSFASSGSNVIQYADITDCVLQPGLYYIGGARDSTSSTGRLTISTVYTAMFDIKTLASAFPLPADASAWTDSSDNYIPIMGATSRA